MPLAGVPKAGVTKVGDVARTTAPEPVVEANLAEVTVPSAGVPIETVVPVIQDILFVPIAGAVENVSVVPLTV